MCKFCRPVNFSLSMKDIRSRSLYEANDHVNYFYDTRRSLMGEPNRDIKLIASQLNQNGSCDFLFKTDATPYPDELFHEYKELEYAPMTRQVNANELTNNPTEEYMMCIRINDFLEQLDESGALDENRFDGYILTDILENSQDVKYSCSCPSFMYTGIAYNATQQGASLMPSTMEPDFWKKLRGNALCCKHLEGLFKYLGFFIPQCAQSLGKTLAQSGLID